MCFRGCADADRLLIKRSSLFVGDAHSDTDPNGGTDGDRDRIGNALRVVVSRLHRS
jgi:hypothetical protein